MELLVVCGKVCRSLITAVRALMSSISWHFVLHLLSFLTFADPAAPWERGLQVSVGVRQVRAPSGPGPGQITNSSPLTIPGAHHLHTDNALSLRGTRLCVEPGLVTYARSLIWLLGWTELVPGLGGANPGARNRLAKGEGPHTENTAAPMSHLKCECQGG